MKKKLVFALVVLLCIGIGNDSFAARKKKKNAAATTDQTVATDSSANAAAVQPAVTEPPKVVTPEPEVQKPVVVTLGDSSQFNINSLVADTGVQVMDDYVIDTTKPSDGFYKLSTLRGAKPFPFPDEKVSNIKKYKRLWRIIDVTDSANRIFAVPGETLIASIMDAIKAGKLVAYKDEEFKKQLTYQQAMNCFKDSLTINTFDDDGNVNGTKTVLQEFNPDSVTKYEIKEDIYFDKVRGRVVTEIISLAPIRTQKSSTGQDIGIQHPFYLYFKQLRKMLAAREVTDLPRDISNVSYDDMFISRNFHSRIIKEASPSGLSIKDKYPNEADQIRESNRIEQEIRNFKRGLFKYY